MEEQIREIQTSTHGQQYHTASNLKEPSGVCQLTLGRILNLHKQAGSNNLGR